MMILVGPLQLEIFCDSVIVPPPALSDVPILKPQTGL